MISFLFLIEGIKLYILDNKSNYFIFGIIITLLIVLIYIVIYFTIIKIKNRRKLQGKVIQYNSIINDINYGVYMSPGDPDDHFTFVNVKMAELLGYENTEELLSMSMRKLFTNPLELTNFLKEAKVNGFVKNKHIRIRKKDSSFLWISHTARVVYDKNSDIKSIYGLVQDLNDKKIVKQSLLKSYEKLENIIEERTQELLETNEKLRNEIEEREIIERKLRYYATTDTMTGVFNRMTGLVFLENQIKIAKRNNNYLVVCFIDIDNLKAVNDLHGHKEGDILIVNVSRILKSVIRESDSICRMGGDEFLIIFPDCNIDQVNIIWQRVDKEIEKYNSSVVDHQIIKLSYGFAEYNPENNISVEEIIVRADMEMYKEKSRHSSTNEIL